MEPLANRVGCTIIRYIKSNVAMCEQDNKMVVLLIKPQEQILPSLNIVSEYMPKILTYGYVTEGGDSMYTVAEYINSPTFCDCVDVVPTVSDLESISQQLHSAIGDIHSYQYCHCDLIGYGNVLINRVTNVVTVLDVDGREFTRENVDNDLKAIKYILFSLVYLHPSDRDATFDLLLEEMEAMMGSCEQPYIEEEYVTLFSKMIAYYPNYKHLL